MTDNILVFDRKTIRQNRNRCSSKFEKHNFLFEWCRNEINSRLDIIKRKFPLTLQIGGRSLPLDNKKFGIQSLYNMDSAERLHPSVIADDEFIPFKHSQFDLVTNILGLHTINDLPGHLIQIKNILKPDGLFFGVLFGDETLYELRQCLQQAEIEITGGISPRVAPFSDKVQMGSLLQRSGFSLPVIDSEKITVTYENIFKLMHDLRFMGESNTLLKRSKLTARKEIFLKAGEIYQKEFSETGGRIQATFDIIFIHGWAPHESQQKPLRPGSAESTMAEALKSKEEKLPC